MPLMAVLHEMPHDLFLLCLRNALISSCEQTAEGQEWLKTAHRLEQTEPDYAKIRAQPGYRPEAGKE